MYSVNGNKRGKWRLTQPNAISKPNNKVAFGRRTRSVSAAAGISVPEDSRKGRGK